MESPSVVPRGTLRHSLLWKVGQSVAVVVLASLVISTVWYTAVEYQRSMEDLNREADRQADELQAILSPLIWNLDENSVRNILKSKLRSPSLLSVEVDADGAVLFLEAVAQITLDNDKGATIHREREVVYYGQKIADLRLLMTETPSLQTVALAAQNRILFQLVLFLALMFTLFAVLRSPLQRVRTMADVIRQFTVNQAEARMEASSRDELGVLARGFNAMADQILAVTRGMEAEIRERTALLVNAEKMALVGNLVAGVAHEINTPVGNSITLASWLSTRVRQLEDQVASGEVTREELSEFLTDSRESLRVLESGLQRTAQLIQTFKKIGADQVNDAQAQLRVEDFLKDVTTSLYHTYKNRKQTLEVDCSPGLELTTNPGALFQVVTNLVINAYTHAFDQEQPGTIVIRARYEDHPKALVRIQVVDNGRGMDEAVLSKVFTPFFTTNRKRGGTGLGLSIASNLVSGLGGTLEVNSTVGRGTTFEVRLPCNECHD